MAEPSTHLVSSEFGRQLQEKGCSLTLDALKVVESDLITRCIHHKAICDRLAKSAISQGEGVAAIRVELRTHLSKAERSWAGCLAAARDTKRSQERVLNGNFY